jgi:hypothetical protein
VRKLAQQVMGAEEAHTVRQGGLLKRLAAAVKPAKAKAA